MFASGGPQGGAEISLGGRPPPLEPPLLRRTMEYQRQSVDDGGKYRQPISTRHLEATTGVFTHFTVPRRVEG